MMDIASLAIIDFTITNKELPKRENHKQFVVNNYIMTNWCSKM